ncbi:MAG: DUF1080 domain-containing protein [Acidobacteria bacterium]|nr:DUF1080 domain-containing protein [Acidobacteriota bacterium]
MKRISATAVALLLVGCLSAVFAPAASGQAGGWTNLMNMSHWTPVGKVDWKVIGREFWSTNGQGFLLSKQSYGDFEIRAEFWVSPDANSGIFIRCQDPGKVGAQTCYEVNIFDTRPDPAYRTGAIVDVAKPRNMAINTGNKWNTYEITAKGPRMIIRLNGDVTVDVEDRKFARGPFALQAGVGVVRFRNVQIRELKGTT